MLVKERQILLMLLKSGVNLGVLLSPQTSSVIAPQPMTNQFPLTVESQQHDSQNSGLVVVSTERGDA